MRPGNKARRSATSPNGIINFGRHELLPVPASESFFNALNFESDEGDHHETFCHN